MLPFRQVHLDFHTAPQIAGIGAAFDAAAFVATLQTAHVDSVTVFAKCHHGYSYYPTRVGTPHPQLARPDLLGEMITACHAAGIRAPVYTTVTWDEHAWHTHPEWRQIGTAGGTSGPGGHPLRPGWKNLCMNTGYGEYVIAQNSELLEMYAVDALFIDITRYIGGPCICSTCLAQIQEQGIDPTDPQALAAFMLATERRFMTRCTAAIRAVAPDCGIFYNSRLRVAADPALGNRAELDDFTHLEIESLPGGFWGYDHFPLYVRHFQTFPRPLMMMTGRFHTTWGDFGGLRNRAALEFECFQGLAHGAVSSIGDQLHPRGRLEPAVYARIGEIYAEIERREPFVKNSLPLVDIGVVTTKSGARDDLTTPTDIGVLHALEQLKHQFEIIDYGCDLARYRLIVLPDTVHVDAVFAGKLRDYVASGGRLLASAQSGLAAGRFVLEDLLGVQALGAAPFAPDYLLLGEQLGTGIEPMPHIAEHRGVQIVAAPGTTILATAAHPYFNRTWQHFCSHQYTPDERDSSEPLVTRCGNVVYLALPLFTEYATSARRVHRQIIGNAIAQLLPDPLIGQHNLPTTAIVTLRQQQERTYLHVLHYVHQRRGEGLDIIEDRLPLHDIQIQVRLEHVPGRVTLVPEGVAAAFTHADGYVTIDIPRVDGYQIIEIA